MHKRNKVTFQRGPALKYYRRYLQFMSVYYTHIVRRTVKTNTEKKMEKRRNCGEIKNLDGINAKRWQRLKKRRKRGKKGKEERENREIDQISESIDRNKEQ